jgi:hypothetical protein
MGDEPAAAICVNCASAGGGHGNGTDGLQRPEFEELIARVAGFIHADPRHAGYWRGYLRGLQRAHYGDREVGNAEHGAWLRLAEDADPEKALRGRGYCNGVTAGSVGPRNLDVDFGAG